MIIVHFYCTVSTMTSRTLILIIVALCFVGASCKKSSQTVPLNGSSYTSLMCGTRPFHYYASYNPNTIHSSLDSFDTTRTIVYLNNATVSIDADHFTFDPSSSDSCLVYNYSDPHDYNLWEYRIAFNRYVNSVVITRKIHRGAADNESIAYISF